MRDTVDEQNPDGTWTTSFPLDWQQPRGMLDWELARKKAGANQGLWLARGYFEESLIFSCQSRSRWVAYIKMVKAQRRFKGRFS